jgi:hypothetical protein
MEMQVKRKWQMRSPPPEGGNLIPFPGIMRLQSLARKRAVLAQSQQAVRWIEWLIDLDEQCLEKAEELGLGRGEAQLRSMLNETYRKSGAI